MDTQKEVLSLAQEYKTIEVLHPVYRAVLQEITLLIECPMDAEFFAVFGPPGVGKTRLCQTIGEQALKIYNRMESVKPGELPIVLVTAPAPSKKRPNWKELFSRVLEELNKPYSNAPTAAKQNVGFGADNRILSAFSHTGTASIRRALRDAIAFRNTKLILIDEGHHTTDGLALKEQVSAEMDNLKNLAQETNTLIGLLGTYQLLPLLTANGQLSRRVTPFHYPRYGGNSPVIRNHYDRTLNAFIEQMPVTGDSKRLLMEYKEFFYVRSLGCVGITAKILGKVCWRALRIAKGAVTEEMIKKAALLAGCSRCIEEEILKGEAEWAKLVAEQPELQSAEVAGEEAADITKNERRPGRRDPTRDAVGGADA